MRRLFFLALAGLFVLSLAACGGSDVPSGTYSPSDGDYGFVGIGFSGKGVTFYGVNGTTVVLDISGTYKIKDGKLLVKPDNSDNTVYLTNIFGNLGGQVVFASDGYGFSCTYKAQGENILLGGKEFVKTQNAFAPAKSPEPLPSALSENSLNAEPVPDAETPTPDNGMHGLSVLLGGDIIYEADEYYLVSTQVQPNAKLQLAEYDELLNGGLYKYKNLVTPRPNG